MDARGDIGAAPIQLSYNSNYAFTGSNPVLTAKRCITIGFESRISTWGCVCEVKCDRWKTASNSQVAEY